MAAARGKSVHTWWRWVRLGCAVAATLAWTAGCGWQSRAVHPGKNAAETAKPLNQRPVPMRVIRHGNHVELEMTAEETSIQIADGVWYHAWTFDGTVPGPVIWLRQGDEVTLRLHNADPHMAHAIDLHAALVAPNQAFVDVPPGQTRTLHFTAKLPGVFMYHCASQPMLQHIGNGMYGAVVVVPPGGPVPAYTLVQSEFYRNGDFTQMARGRPQYVVFNGRAFQYVQHPLPAKVGKPVYIAFVNAGPNEFAAFHVVGTVLRDVMPSGSPRTHLYDLQTYTVAPGDGALIRLVFDAPGMYPFVTHDMADMTQGAMGMFRVTP
ncbi:hypothetical protein GCM10010885_15210 [Alicyclobacillus cellulosilyticus]|uniref:Copper-containing nitrite reductase n=1 Tax=Alicyclobacillus cellulosilyticus TaxID=1003997 RepID=A0A917KCM6_9BACL|nr:multicopper oxidase domain-containing protein [Alicyclobacillus cellulosilyticus]GGJ07003.1 hypothetical protein GCM10010885_15210 [Alicyclobacillus cellulosilyticus]